MFHSEITPLPFTFDLEEVGPTSKNPSLSRPTRYYNIRQPGLNLFITTAIWLTADQREETKRRGWTARKQNHTTYLQVSVTKNTSYRLGLCDYSPQLLCRLSSLKPISSLMSNIRLLPGAYLAFRRWSNIYRLCERLKSSRRPLTSSACGYVLSIRGYTRTTTLAKCKQCCSMDQQVANSSTLSLFSQQKATKRPTGSINFSTKNLLFIVLTL